MANDSSKPSGIGIAAGVLGALAALGGIAAAASAGGGKKSAGGLRGARGPVRLKKPCGCGR